MSAGDKKRSRSRRVAPLELPPGRLLRIVTQLRREGVLLRLGLCTLTVLVIWSTLRAWEPTFEYHEGFVPVRDIDARVMFRKKNQTSTDEAKRRAEEQTPLVYRQDPAPLVQLRFSLLNQVKEILDAPTFSDVKPEQWQQFELPAVANVAPLTAEQQEEEFEAFRQSLAVDETRQRFENAIVAVFTPLEENGLLDKLPEKHVNGSQKEIWVYPIGRPKMRDNKQAISNVLIGDASRLRESLYKHLESRQLADRVFFWLRPRLMSTLQYDEMESQLAREEARQSTPDEYDLFEVGHVLAKAGVPLTRDTIDLLKLEHAAYVPQRSLERVIYRSLAMLCLIACLTAVVGYYVLHYQPQAVWNGANYVSLLLVAIGTIALSRLAAADPYRAELLPLLICGLICAVAFNRELALLMTVSLVVVLVIGGGLRLGEFVVMVGTIATGILLVRNIRTRTRLIYIGFYAGVAAFILTVGVGVLEVQPLKSPLLTRALFNGLWAFAAGFAMTGLLPFVETRFGVLTELRLLEFGDVSHPLLQELVRRAPGTYNHSINVASIAEAAAESIGARGLLVRVGAYFHDIGKMCKPSYFVENQSAGVNRHDTLVPTMSTLIIIAHVKDGADLARQHKLPAPIIEFIEQHHGTTLVEYFYRRASERSESDPDSAGVEESSFRYPGPKPQIKETAVLMLADAVESASRVLAGPTPARIESLVEGIAMKRLLDGQFDECGLTLKELRQVEDSLIKSLTAIFHGRVQYPEQRSTA